MLKMIVKSDFDLPSDLLLNIIHVLYENPINSNFHFIET